MKTKTIYIFLDESGAIHHNNPCKYFAIGGYFVELEDKNKVKHLYKRYNYKIKKKTRFDIVNNYLSPRTSGIRFRNKYQIMQAVKNINDELEEAEKEFEKLFKENKPQIT